MLENFHENFYKLCSSLGIVEQLVTSGYLESPTLINNKGAEQLVKANLTDDLSWIEEYRELFKKSNTGRPGLCSDLLSVTNKMKRFQVQFGYTKDQILEATRDYIKDTDPNFIQEADYFIFKKDGKKNEERSKLAAWCEISDAKESVYTLNL